MDLAAIVGPTAVGKTSISLAVAAAMHGEIISCDSMQVYQGMDIGTAKATVAERQTVPHHLIDLVHPDVNFSVADYQILAKQAIRDIASRNKLPILVGGTGLYYQAVVDDYDFFPVQSQDEARRKWEGLLCEYGLDYLFAQLQQIDPEYAEKVGMNDKKRIIRALEVFDLTGQPFSSLQKRQSNTYNLASVGLRMDRAQLYRRIEQRVDEMVSNGLIEEVIALREKGYGPEHNSMQALGYKQVNSYLDGYISREDMIEDIKKETRRFAKRQFTWFNRDKRIVWIDTADYKRMSDIVDRIIAIFNGRFYRKNSF